jgi:hypothetical protein
MAAVLSKAAGRGEVGAGGLAGDVGELAGDVGELAGDVGELAGDAGEVAEDGVEVGTGGAVDGVGARVVVLLVHAAVASTVRTAASGRVAAHMCPWCPV